MSFAVGAEVVVRTLANKRGVVVHAGQGGRYRVQVENVTLWCDESDLTAPPPAKKGKGRAPSANAPPTGTERDSVRPIRLDLHGLTVEDALARLLETINQAILRGADRVEVVHGKGSGRIKQAVHRHLATIPSVAAFKLDEHNPGVTWVFL